MELTISDIFKKAFRSYRDNICIVEGTEEFTYQQVEDRVKRIATGIEKYVGVKKGDRIAILSSNRKECIELDVAIAISGLVKVPLNYRLHVNEHIYMVNDSKSKVLFVESQFLKKLTHYIKDMPYVEAIIVIGNDEPQTKKHILYEELLEYSSNDKISNNEESRCTVLPEDLYAIMYTSGTTGRPKGVMLSQENFALVGTSLIIETNLGPDERIGHFTPLTHGTNFFVTAGFQRGSVHVIFNQFTAKGFLENVKRYQITTIFLVPTMINLLIHEPGLHDADLSSLRTILYAGSPIAVEKLKLAIDIFGERLVQSFGQMESPMAVTILDRYKHLEFKENDSAALASCGREAVFSEVKIVGNQGEVLEPNEVGEVYTRGPLVMQGYWSNEKATKETLKDGWLKTGDLGYLDQSRNLFLVDRKKDVIISGGMNIYPREVEEVIYIHPAVKEVCVFGIPESNWGESVCAHVVLKEGFELQSEEMIEHCRNHIASYKKPKVIKFVDELPKNNYGKIMRRQIREGYWKNERKKVK